MKWSSINDIALFEQIPRPLLSQKYQNPIPPPQINDDSNENGHFFPNLSILTNTNDMQYHLSSTSPSNLAHKSEPPNHTPHHLSLNHPTPSQYGHVWIIPIIMCTIINDSVITISLFSHIMYLFHLLTIIYFQYMHIESKILK